MLFGILGVNVGEDHGVLEEIGDLSVCLVRITVGSEPNLSLAASEQTLWVL